jgi:N-acetylglucosaminyldiphosphoundecaprenol N-acetyl-beta-D-mannosaminyltransferase
MTMCDEAAHHPALASACDTIKANVMELAMVDEQATTKKVSLFGVQIDAIRMPDAINCLTSWINEDGYPCRYIVTPNVDHVILLGESPAFREVYDDAALILADGWPVVAASRLLGRSLPERVPGSDLVPKFFAAAQGDDAYRDRPVTVYLLGAMPGVADRAAANIHQRWPNVKVVGTFSPPLGFEKDEAQCADILDRIAEVRPDLLVIGLGAPKQEYWVHRFQGEIQAKVALCVGATIDFLAGEKKRAPKWVQRIGMEWFHRMASEPRRLAKRYARDAWIFPQLVWREARSERREPQ